MGTKVCRKCGRELPTSEFHKKSASKDGLQPYCKECVLADNAQHTSRNVATTGGGNLPPFSDADFDGKDPGEVVRMMGRAKRWLESRGYTINLSGEYRKIEVKKLKFNG